MTADSTLQGLQYATRSKAGVVGRRVALAIMALAVLIGATGFLGVKAQTVYAQGGGYSMSLTYAKIARPGLDIPWRLTIRNPAGFPKQFTIAVSNRYWDILEYQDLHPEPSDETADPRFVYLTFTPAPHSKVFSLSLDTYIQPASQVGRHAITALMIGSTPVAEVSYTTWLVP